MVPPRKEQLRTRSTDPNLPAADEGPENAKNARKENVSRTKPDQPTPGQTRGRDQIAQEMSAEEARTRGRDQTAREMAGRNRQK
jgi:hypothetical protein